MTDLAAARAFVGNTIGLGGILQPCTADGTPLRAPGQPPALAIDTVEVGDDATHPDAFALRLSSSTVFGRDITLVTSDPWAWHPELHAWLIPSITDGTWWRLTDPTPQHPEATP